MATVQCAIGNFAKMDQMNGDPKPKTKEVQSIEKTYQKKSQLEHILLRPDTYIGSVEKAHELMWIYDTEKECMVQRQIRYVPGLYKIFDEILVNAADNKQRDPTMDSIKIDINAETNTISVWNNGEGIPVVMHKDEKMYVPTMIFGHLLTSSNYNDDEEKVTGGRNGYGAKLCNIFSTKFIVETGSKKYKNQFKQTWGANMTKTSEPKIKDFFGDDFTKVTFCPDLSKFKMEKLDDDIVALMSRRAYDVAASTRGVRVFLNGKRLPVKNFKDYVDLYIKNKEDENGAPLKVAYESVSERWEVALTISDCGFQQVSFVNSIATMKGGRHIDHIADNIVKQLIEVLKKKNRGGVTIKPFQVKNHMWLFINCLIVNPTFDSQTKENMTLQVKNFGSKCTLSEKFITSVSKCGIVENVLSWAKFKAQNELSKQSGRKQSKLKGIPKLEDANDAGTKLAHKCTLILTEGDSAKSLAVSGLSVVGRDCYGVFPLRGKLLNVREATHKQILDNAEINNLIKIIGLQYKKKYLSDDDVKTLRYGKVMIMTDQDQDGSHIKGLIINFIHHNWPDLLQQNFLEEFITPIVKAKRGNEEFSFYSLPEFEEWKQNTPNHNKFNIKYYKGLGTSTSVEAKEYFSNMERHRIRFKYGGPEDDKNLLMAFSKKTVELRKDWLLNHMADCKQRKALGLPERYLYTKNTKHVTYSDFINSELVLYSNSDNIRSIPSLVDGLKPGQRKVLFTCFKRNDKREVKVVQLAGSVAEHSAYHHGEQSLCATIVNLAQNYVGSNNINLLEPRGQFGTRLCGGKDSASPRYIFTLMSPLTRLIFHPHDDPLLQYEVDDNQKIEPKWYIPIIPMVLVNGADGIGTGWMTKIPNYNPREIVANLRRMLDGEEPKHMIPWYKNFRGTIVECSDERCAVSGEIAVLESDKLEISELPIGVWTQTYKENVLEVMLHGTEKSKATISDYKEYNTDTTVKFVVTPLPGQLTNMEQEGLHKAFRLQTSIATTSMVLFDEMSCLKKYESVEVILKEFFDLRLRMYQKRKDFLEGSLQAEADKLSFQAKFIVEKCNGTIKVEDKKRKTIIEELKQRGYPFDPVKEWHRKMIEDEADEEEQVEDGEEGEGESSSQKKAKEKGDNSSEGKKFDYLLGMSMWVLTTERKNELLKQRDAKIRELEMLRMKTPADLWKADLDKFMTRLTEVEEKEKQEQSNMPVKKAAKGGRKKDTTETLPSPNGRRIEPSYDELKKKFTKAKETKERKNKKEKGSTTDLTDEKDEFDALVENRKSLTDKLGTSPEAIAKKASGKAKREKEKKINKKKDKYESGDDDKNSSDSMGEKSVEVLPKRERTSRRVTTKKITYSFDSEEDSDSGDQELFENNLEGNDAPAKIMTDSEEEAAPVRRTETSEDLFDSLVGRKPESQSESIDDKELDMDDGDAKPVAQPKSRKREKKKFAESDGSDDDFEYETPPKKTKGTGGARRGRNTKPITYADMSDSD